MTGKIGRISDEEITVFDAVGIPTEDSAVAWEVYQKAIQVGVGTYVDFIGLLT